MRKVIVVGVVVVLVGFFWRAHSRAQTQRIGQSTPNTVRTLPPGQSPVSDPGQKGATYYWLENRVLRVTSHY